MTTTTVSVKGMTCMGCVSSVTKALNLVPGVQAVDVSLDNHVATVTFDEATTNVETLKSAIEDAGYDVEH